MSTTEDQFLKSLRATFKVEATEHLATISRDLLALEKPISLDRQQPLVATVFRAAHSLKGAARAVNLPDIESVCQALEDIFASWKRRETVPSTPALDLIHRALDDIAKEIAEPESESPRNLFAHVDTLHELILAAPGTLPEMKSDVQPASDTTQVTVRPLLEKREIAEAVRVPIAKLEAQLLEAEEMLAAKLAMRQRLSELSELTEHLDKWKKELEKIQPTVRTARSLESQVQSLETRSRSALRELLEFAEWNHDYFRALEAKTIAQRKAAVEDNLLVGKLVDELLEDSKKLLMLPISTLTGFFQRLVRDLCRDQGKQADLVIEGETVEVDKRILEGMKDPLIHIIRNSIDHGLETPENRKQRQKPDRATITLKVSPVASDKIELLISDDGVGVDVEKAKESAVRHGAISSTEASQLTEAEALQLVLLPDVSTSPMITELSGRGLGLAIVREQTEKLGGFVSVESSLHKGTAVRITLPIALRTFRGILVASGKQMFVVPTLEVERVARFNQADVQTVEGRETVALNGRAVALCRLSDVLELPSSDSDVNTSVVLTIVIGARSEHVAFAVDAVLAEQEILVKRFARPLEHVRNISGATVLGSGHVAPILNVPDLLKSAKQIGSVTMPLRTSQKTIEKKTKSILLVEDSITSRMLLKSILESAGYAVTTAVDGIDAFTILRTQPFDAVVSDVEMPRQNGFDLTARIRADKKLSNVPVILVTALETREDRERGLDVGANAYLVKSSFDQSNLLAAVRRLI